MEKLTQITTTYDPKKWKLVPEQITQEMAVAAKWVDGRLSVWKYSDVYRAMLDAAPEKENG